MIRPGGDDPSNKQWMAKMFRFKYDTDIHEYIHNILYMNIFIIYSDIHIIPKSQIDTDWLNTEFVDKLLSFLNTREVILKVMSDGAQIILISISSCAHILVF